MTTYLAPGARIAVVAPSHKLRDLQNFERGLAIARRTGLVVEPLPNMLRPHRYFAGDDAHRASQLMEALSSDAWDGVWMARGGYGLTRLLPLLDPARICPKPVLGFSDGTALFAFLHRHGKGPSIHGPVVNSLPSTDAASVDHLFDLLAGRPVAPLVGESWVEGGAEGWLCGGNIALFAALAGTPWQLDLSGAIVVLEEVGEEPYRLDRLLQQLVSSGFFRGVRGIGIGQLVDCKVPAEDGYTLPEIVVEHLGPLGVPIVGDLPVGHGSANRAFPYGAAATLAGGRLTWT